MKNLIFVISACAFFSFSFISSDFFSAENEYHKSDLSYSENGFPNFPNPKDSSEPTDSSADNSPEVSSPLKDVSGMFNERGYYKSNSFSFDDQEIINDFNGNLLYSVPMYSYALGGDMNLQMKLTYNGSVGHIITTSDTDRIRNQASVYSRRNINFPEWIIDLNGFALQTLNFETNFFTENNGANYVQGSSVNAIITGYHYDNELGLVNIDNKDKINILSGDGSIITLENENYSGDSTNLYNYIGDYVYKGKEAYYQAKVTYIGTALSSIAGNNPRKIILLKGDGLEYIFEEQKIHFDDFLTDESLVNGKLRPIAIYLKEIRDRFSHSIKISYTPNHPFPIDPDEKLKGRQLLQSITTSGISSTITNASFWFEYGPSICKIFHQSELNGNYSIIYDTPVGYRSSDNYKNQRGTVGKIINILNQKSEFTYGTYLRRYNQLFGLYENNPQQGQFLDVSLNDLKRMKSSKTNLGLKRDYLEYLAPDSISINLSTFYSEGNEKSVIGALNDYMGYGRDPFYVNMLKKKSDSLIVLKSETTYDYEYSYSNRPGTNPSDDVQIHPVNILDDYSTIRTLVSKETVTENNSVTSAISKKYYKVYPVFNPNNAYEISIDKDGITKLVKEENLKPGTTNKYVSTIYSYEIGSFSVTQNGYDGSFLNKNKKVYPENLTSYSEWSWNYTYQNNDPNKPVIQSTEYDPFGNYSVTDYAVYDTSFWHKEFLSDWINNVYIESYFYKINIPVLEKRFSPNGDSLQRKSYTYITDTSSTLGYFGQLVSEKIYKFPSFSEYIETSYEYYRNDTTGKHVFSGTGIFPYKEGNIKLKKTNDEETKFFYTPISLSEVDRYGIIPEADEPPGIPYLKFKVKYNNNSVLDTNSKIWDFRFPIRTDNYKINGSTRDTLSITYRSYTLDGSPTKMIDQNKYMTQFVYEPIHRLNSITLPGDFSTNKDSVALYINFDTLKTWSEIKSVSWGNYDPSNGIIDYYSGSGLETPNFYCGTGFAMDMNQFEPYYRYAYFRLNNDIPMNFYSIDSAYLTIFSRHFEPKYNSQIVFNQNYYKTYIKGITELTGSEVGTPVCQAPWQRRTATIDNFRDTINLPYQDSCTHYQERKASVKNLFNDVKSRGKIVKGLTLYSDYTGPIGEDDITPYSKFDLYLGYCAGNPTIEWYDTYSPKVDIYGTLDISDTLKIPIIKGGTIKYYYDDINHKVNVYSARNSQNNDRSRIQYAIDGYGNIKQKDIFTSISDSNTYEYKFNYLNQPAENLDALDLYTKFSYDGLGRIIKTKNADTSSTLNSYSYYDSLVYTFGTVKNVISKQRFTDEEGNPFDKYFDAVGNLLREVKFVSIPAPEEDFPSTSLITDYKYDSLYRVTEVKTPNNKNIYYSYDGYGRQIKRITPDAGQTDYIFDNSNNLTYSQDANQRNTNSFLFTFRNYDGLNRLTGIGDGMFDIDSPYDGTQSNQSQPTNYYTINVYDTISNSIVDNLFTGVGGYAALNYTKGNLAATAYRTRKTDSWNFKYYRYDVRGRVIKMWNIISGFDTLITDYFYNSQDQVTDYSHTGKGEKISYRNSYDYAGRLDRADKYDIPDIPNPDFINLAAYSYNPNSQVLQNDLNDGNIRLYYFYNNRGWISEMFDNNGFLDYTNDYFKNGNVKSQQISGNYNDNFTVSTDLSYTYGYDKSNRLLTSENADKIYDLTNSFDKDGNILSLVRTNGIGSVSDDFSYAYYSGTNKLQRVTGAGSQFSYDANGNLIQDAFNNNNEILYDYRNLITELKHRSQIIGDTVYLTKYYYDEAGNRIRKMTYAYLQPITESEPPANSDVSNTSNWALRNDEVYSRDVSGKEMAIYQNNSLLEYPTYGLDMIGKIKDDELHFYLKDHLGSIRATVYDNKLISAQDYDAWGYILEGRTYESEEGKFKFTGKERDEESFYDYFGARYYDARIGRWGQVEPLFEKYLSFSPYIYGICNPTRNIDVNGEDNYVFNEDGIFVRIEKNDDNYLIIENSKIGYRDWYDFNDPDKDVSDIEYLIKKYGQSAKLVYFKKDSDLLNTLSESGVMTKEAQENPIKYTKNSSRSGKMDYWYSYLGPELANNGISLEDVNSDKGSFFVFQGVNKAYNPMDAGNFYWGGGMQVLGIPLDIAKLAAHFNNARDSNYGGIFDSKYDQKAIESGYNKLNK